VGRVVEAAYAKVNLALDVGALRSDGYHSIHSVMQSLALRDELILEERAAGISVTCLAGDPLRQGALDAIVSQGGCMPPSDQRNIAWQAAEMLMKETGERRGLHITIRKAVPLAAGLGGGSADAAAVLRGLNRLWNLGLSVNELMKIGARVGADVPFCVAGGTAEVKGIGEKVNILPSIPPWPIVLVKPPVGVSTAMCYSDYDRLPQPIRVDVDMMVRALALGDLSKVALSLGNSLEVVTFKQLPFLAELKSMLVASGCLGVSMSGSGPTLFGLVRDVNHGHEVLQRLKARLMQEAYGKIPKVYLTMLKPHGEPLP